MTIECPPTPALTPDVRAAARNRRRRTPQAAWLVAAAYRALQRVMIFDISQLFVIDVKTMRPPQVDARFTFRFLTPDEVRKYSLDPANELEASLAERIPYGRDFCCATFDGDRLANYCWFAVGSIEAEQNRGRSLHSGVAISFPPDTMFGYKMFTHPEYRGQGLASACSNFALREIRERGVTRLLATAEWVNRSLVSGSSRLGHIELGLICRFGWGPATITFTPRRAAACGYLVGKKAQVHPRVPLACG